MPNSDPHLLERTAPGLAAAQAAPRCIHIKLNGQRCAAPALHGHSICRFHTHAYGFARQIPFIEDAAAIQVGLMKIVRSIESGALDYKQASLMLYALQIATMNLKRLEAAMAQTSSAADEAREKSLAEELLARIDDEDFCKAVLADAPPLDSIPPTWGALGSLDPKEPDGGNSGGTPK